MGLSDIFERLDRLTGWSQPQQSSRAITPEDFGSGADLFDAATNAGERVTTDKLHVKPTAKRQGYGSAALRLVIDDLRRRHPGLRRFSTSCMPGADSPRPFYERLGFVFDGELDEDEEVGYLDLTRWA